MSHWANNPQSPPMFETLRAREVHSDGSPKNVCGKCVEWIGFERGDHLGRGICGKFNKGNMWFGNCDYWLPKDQSGEALEKPS